MTNQTQVQHTRGPWKVASDEGIVRIEADDDGECTIAEIDTENTEHIIALADARLIASAPDLLAALEAGLEHIERTCRTEHYISSTDDCQSCAEPAFDARAAIRRARGED